MDREVLDRRHEHNRAQEAGAAARVVGAGGQGEPPPRKKRKRAPAAGAGANGLAGSNGSAPPAKEPPAASAAAAAESLQKQEQADREKEAKPAHHPSPFRIRAGCVVALRSRRDDLPRLALVRKNPEPSSAGAAGAEPPPAAADVATTKTTTTSTAKHGGPTRVTLLSPSGANEGWIRVWTSPVPGRDEGLNLIGKRVRAQVPLVRPGQDRTVLEGEIVRLLDCCNSSGGRDGSLRDRQGPPKQHPHKPLKVELLVDVRQLERFPFLKKADDPLAASPAQPQQAPQHDRRRRERQRDLELRIRGRGTAPVVVKLAPARAVLAFGSGSSSSSSSSAGSSPGGEATYFGSTRLEKASSSSPRPDGLESAYRENAKKASSVGLAWAIERSVPSRPSGWWGRGPSPLLRPSPKPKSKPPPPPESGGSEPRERAHSAEARGKSDRDSLLMAPAGDLQKKNGGTNGVHSSGKNNESSTGPSAGTATKAKSSIATAKSADAKKGGERKGSSAAAGAARGVRHAGDGADPPDRQVENWRWLAGRYHDLLLRSSLPTSSEAPKAAEVLSSREGLLAQILSGGLLGEVVSIERTDGADADESLAQVTIRRLVLPEHTVTGRLPHHAEGDVFDDGDELDRVFHQLASPGSSSVADSAARNQDVLIEVPIEHLVIVSRKLHRRSGESCFDSSSLPQSAFDQLQLSHSYSFRRDAYRGLSPELSYKLSQAESIRRQDAEVKLQLTNNLIHSLAAADKAVDRVTPSGSLFSRSRASAGALSEPIDFELPPCFLDITTIPKPQLQPVKTRVSPVKRAANGKTGEVRTSASGTKKKTKEGSEPVTVTESLAGMSPLRIQSQQQASKKEEDYEVFKPTCARLLAYDSTQNRRGALSPCLIPDRPRNLRQFWLEQKRRDPDSQSATKVDDRSTSRANRANQRRLLKDAAASASWLMGVNALSCREPQLRFDRSGIHSWGVFADEDITAEEMIIEYRGELINNAVAEKREREYLDAKIGSDYMFRIDSHLVCDATKLGNVARFINASCDPNCYTKIITLDGNKRIVIYAKRDIRAGEELCYDYKFPLEYDESKRIPCHCGAKDCRGFMNWDKRYVVLADAPPPSELSATSFVSTDAPGLRHEPMLVQTNSRDVSRGSRTPSPPCDGKSPADSSLDGATSLAR